MVFAIQIFQIIFYSIAVIFMGTLIFLSIWSFVTFNRMYQSQRIQNFLLDKIYQSISTLNQNDIYSPTPNEDLFNVDEFINEDELFNSQSSTHNTNNDTILYNDDNFVQNQSYNVDNLLNNDIDATNSNTNNN